MTEPKNKHMFKIYVTVSSLAMLFAGIGILLEDYPFNDLGFSGSLIRVMLPLASLILGINSGT